MRVYALIGYPLEYTLSPEIHNYVFRRVGIEAIYVPLRIPPYKLQPFIEVARDALNGFNVTIPHKVSIVERLDELSSDAKEIGSVNTVLNSNGKLIGYNTDYVAIRDSLKERGYGGGGALIMGAGGVARAAVLALRDLGCRVIIVSNRTRERAVELCNIANRLGVECRVTDWPPSHGNFELLINATPLGVNEDFPLDPANIAEIVVDLPYSPRGETRLVRLARLRGLTVIDGIEILVKQALEADKIWIGREINVSWIEVASHIQQGSQVPA